MIMKKTESWMVIILLFQRNFLGTDSESLQQFPGRDQIPGPTSVSHKKISPSGCTFFWAYFWLSHFPICRICLCFACWFVIRPGCREMFECGFLLLRWFDYSHKKHPYFITMLFISSLSAWGVFSLFPHLFNRISSVFQPKIWTTG